LPLTALPATDRNLPSTHCNVRETDRSGLDGQNRRDFGARPSGLSPLRALRRRQIPQKMARWRVAIALRGVVIVLIPHR
jgi:hypothetical protein